MIGFHRRTPGEREDINPDHFDCDRSNLRPLIPNQKFQMGVKDLRGLLFCRGKAGGALNERVSVILSQLKHVAPARLPQAQSRTLLSLTNTLNHLHMRARAVQVGAHVDMPQNSGRPPLRPLALFHPVWEKLIV